MLQNERLAVVDSYRYLGVILDSTLLFEHHLKSLNKNVSHKLYLLTKIRRFLTPLAAERVYKAMLLPYFDYVDIFYEASTIANLEKM